MSEVHKLKSSNLDTAEYRDGHVIVKFKDGASYQYSNVPRSLFQELIKAKSAGSFLHHSIKGKYTHKRLGEEKKK